MEISEQYSQTVLLSIEEIRRLGKPVVIFGAGRAGWYIMKVLEHYGISIAVFSDNDPMKQSARYHNYRVLPANEVSVVYPDANIFLGIFLPRTAAAIQLQFHSLGFSHVDYSMAAFLYIYFVEVAGRACERKKLAESIRILFENYREGALHYGYTKDNYFISPYVTSVITQKCSLRCRDCAQLIPYYKAPVHFSAESIINELRQYAKAFDVVPEMSLHGGEPFLHPELAEICKGVAAIPNIIFVSFVTNGTVVPSEDTLRVVSSCGADVNQSGGYGSLSRKQGELIEAFCKHGIYSDIMYCSSTEMWIQSAPPRKHGRTAAENDKIYRRCVASKICCQIMDGELHRCSLSMHGARQGLIPKHEGDFVNLQKPKITDHALIDQIRKFLNRDQALAVCDYCDPDGGALVAPAVQLPKASK